MKREDFAGSPSGRLVDTIGGSVAFVPNPLPPGLDLNRLTNQLARAAQRLGELSGIGRTLPNPYLLVRPFQRKEAVASSRIEGTQTTLNQLFLFEAGADETATAPDAREVANYVKALDSSIRGLDKLPVCLRLIRNAHATLLKGVQKDRGANIVPGEFRDDQNWIGGRFLKDARFVPPPRQELAPALDAFEKYIQQPANPDLHILIRVALVHYQFEAIHPFPDGNGRVGRLLIPLMLHEAKELSHPLFYISPYLERNYDTYIDLMYEVSRIGAWEAWIEFFLRGVEEECTDTIKRIQNLQNIRSDYRQKLSRARASALPLKLVDRLFEAPVITIPAASKFLGITYRAAKNNVEKLVELGILSQIPRDVRPVYFIANAILRAIRDEET